MPVTPEDVDHAAHLSRLRLTEEEKAKFARQLSDIVDYMDKLNELDTSEVEPMVHAIEGAQVLRKDRVSESLSRDQALRNAPEQADGCFKVPRIIE
ncbi:MAG: Asp-tRNA(Asn)/Glu-tRNA(Gln) amidotransferase subunit GatC [Planctomycetota bacterium]